MQTEHRALLAAVGELLLLGPPALEVPLDHFAFGSRTAKRQSRSICMTFALEMGDLASHLLVEQTGKLVSEANDESIGLRECSARRSRRKQRIAGDNRCMDGLARGPGTVFCSVEARLRRLRVTDGRRKLTDACSFGARTHISHCPEPVVGHTAMLH